MNCLEMRLNSSQLFRINLNGNYCLGESMVITA
jgi:hypothetical protein